MTELEMLKHLLEQSGRMYDEETNESKTVIQIHLRDARYEWEFDNNGKFLDEWENNSPSLWLSGGDYYD